jgi:hypothetical protein
MCTRARLVQGGFVSDWFGAPSPTKPPVSVQLTAGEPAYLEMTVDPAAHGDAGLGPITRVVLIQTASGQNLQFVTTAQVTR